MPLTPLTPSSLSLAVVGLCICFYQLLDEGYLDTVVVIKNAIHASLYDGSNTIVAKGYTYQVTSLMICRQDPIKS